MLTTLHTNRATAIVTRLVDMGISPVLLSDSSVLRCLMCQRLIAKVCPDCAVPLRSFSKTSVLYSRLGSSAWEKKS